MAEIDGGELLLRCLEKEKVKRIFGIPDNGYNTVMLHAKDHNIRWIAPRHEAAAVHMAEGVFKTTGEVPVVMAGAGPGTANLVSGIICAKEEGVPVVAITGQRRKEVIYPSKPGVFQGTDQYDIFKPITKWNAVVHDWSRIPEIVQRAFREALAGRPGPVQIDISDSIFHESRDDKNIVILEPHQYRGEVPQISADQVERISWIIRNARTVLLMAGTGVLVSGGTDSLIKLAEILNCPVITSMAARSAFPNDHPNFLFGLQKGGLQARIEAEVVVAFGTRLGELDLPFEKYWGSTGAQKIIQIDVDARNIGANRPIHMGIVADAKSAIDALVTHFKQCPIEKKSGEIIERYRKLDEEQRLEFSSMLKGYNGDRIHPAHSVMIAREVFPPDAINVGDGGNTSLFNAIFTSFTRPRTSLGIFEFGHLGTGIPYAIGAKVANPEKEVYVITGDGAAGFNFMEIETAVREDIKITVIVHAEGSWCMEEIGQIVTFKDPSKVIACEQYPVRWDKVAEGLGAYAEYVEHVDELKGALERARKAPKAAVVCVKTDRQANLIPPAADIFHQVYTGPQD